MVNRLVVKLFSRRFSTASKKIKIVDAVLNKRRIDVRWENSKTSSFNITWLLDNCPSLVTSSNQKTYRTVSSFINVSPVNVKVSEDNYNLQIIWPEKQSSYSSDFLLKNSFDEEYQNKLAERLSPLNQPRDLVKIKFDSIFYGNKVVDPEAYKMLNALNKFGVVIVEKAPCIEKTVLKVSSLMGDPSHKIYGEFFDVKSEINPINIAYTTEMLEFHQDLAYFESPPGIQLLHALKFPKEIKGGESLFIDSLAIAEEFKISHPKHFEVLTKVAATFQKDHSKREHPLKMFYQRPHIITNAANDVIAVFWAPPFEGPLMHPCVTDPDNEMIDLYYEAYGEFQKMLNSPEMLNKHGYEFRLNEGDVVVFNNRRMLHARRSFQDYEDKGERKIRHLQGCYNDIDSFLNNYRLLAEKHRQSSDLDRSTANFEEARQGIQNYR